MNKSNEVSQWQRALDDAYENLSCDLVADIQEHYKDDTEAVKKLEEFLARMGRVYKAVKKAG